MHLKMGGGNRRGAASRTGAGMKDTMPSPQEQRQAAAKAARAAKATEEGKTPSPASSNSSAGSWPKPTNNGQAKKILNKQAQLAAAAKARQDALKKATL